MLTLAGLLGMAGCSSSEKDAVLSPQYGAEFIPLETGRYIEYQVDTLNQNILPIPTRDTGRVFQRHVVRARLDSTSLYRSYQIDVYQRTSADKPWVVRQTNVGILRFDGIFILQEKGIQYQMLTTPFGKGSSWNLNAYNSQNQSNAYTVAFLGLDTDSVARFGGNQDSTCLSSQIETIGFRRGIGLVSRYSYHATFVDNPAAPCSLPVTYQTRQYRKWTYLGSGKL